MSRRGATRHPIDVRPFSTPSAGQVRIFRSGPGKAMHHSLRCPQLRSRFHARKVPSRAPADRILAEDPATIALRHEADALRARLTVLASRPLSPATLPASPPDDWPAEAGSSRRSVASLIGRARTSDLPARKRAALPVPASDRRTRRRVPRHAPMAGGTVLGGVPAMWGSEARPVPGSLVTPSRPTRVSEHMGLPSAA